MNYTVSVPYYSANMIVDVVFVSAQDVLFCVVDKQTSLLAKLQ